MSGRDRKSTLIETFERADKYVGLVAAIVSALTFARGDRYVSYAFILIACILIDIWLWREASTRVEIGLAFPDGKPGLRYVHPTWHRRLLQGGAGLITLCTLLWTSLNLRQDLQPPIDPLTPTPASPPAQMVSVKEGCFTMGGTIAGAPPNTRPVRQVCLKSFRIDAYEVTNAQYQLFVLKDNHDSPVDWSGDKYPPGKNNYPVVNVSWEDTATYCKSVDKRLPTEAEWEKAARGDDQRLWPWEDDPDPLPANLVDSGLNRTQPVGSYPDGKSFYGAYDMAGNVWEWVNDWYESDYYAVAPDQDPPGPPGPPNTQFKVVRGGGWGDNRALAYTFYRLGIYVPTFSNSSKIGFRCARDDYGQ
jgi:formylglycine-generating enzyme required for sulfatase activity